MLLLTDQPSNNWLWNLLEKSGGEFQKALENQEKLKKILAKGLPLPGIFPKGL